MNNKPNPLIDIEIAEISELPDIRAMWGAETTDEMSKLLESDVFAAKFHYHSGTPGYVGDMFVLVGDALGEPVTLIRNQGGSLVICD